MKNDKGGREKSGRSLMSRSATSSKSESRGENSISSSNADSIHIQPQEISLAKILGALKPHDHLCLIYESQETWRTAMVPFISTGLKKGEKCIYIVDSSTAEEIRRYLLEEEVDVASVEKSGQLSILHETETYTKEGSFDPDRMISLLISETEKAISEGYPALRATGEMTWVLRGYPGSEKLIEYEAKLNRDFFPKFPCLAICQYDRWKFNPEIIKGVIMTHPLLVWGNHIYRNFYYIKPEEFLNAKRTEREVQHWLNNLEREQRILEELRESERNFREVTENANDGIIIAGQDGIHLYANKKASEMTGYSIEELLKIGMRGLAHPDEIPRLSERLKRRIDGDEIPRPYETMILHKNGNFVPIEISSSRISWLEKDAVLVILRDITERKQAEEMLRKSEERFRKQFEEALDAIFIANAETGILIDCNRAACELVGWEKSELIGRHQRDLHPAWETGEEFSRTFKQHLQEKEGRVLETQVITKSGEIKEVAIKANLLEFGDQKVLQGIFRDITGQKRTEQALRESEKRFKELFDQAPVGYHEANGEGRITNVNQRELEMLGYTREEIVGRYVWEFIVEEVSEESFKKKIRGELLPGRAFERTYRKKDGDLLPVLIEDRILRDENGKIIGMRSTIQDITERKRVEQEMASLQEQLRQAQKMEAIGRLAGGIAHDFNNLLTVIKGNCELSLPDLHEGDPLKANLEEIKAASERAADLTRQLLAFSRKQIMETKVLDLNAEIMDLEKMFRRIIGEDIELVTFLEDGIGRVKADPSQIEQAIINIVVNARDAMPSGGKLTIETANVELGEEYARKHIAVKPGPYVMLSISDTGLGMSSEVKERVFEPFFTTKEMGKGTGLGLSTVYGIVKQSGGNIWVYSEPGRGTTFKIYLPRVEEPLEEVKEEAIKEIPNGSETVLIVEDEEVVRKLAERLLKKQGYKVLEASDGGKAFMLCEEYKEPIHLILTDVVMPGMSGRDLVKRLKGVHPEVKALFMSGYTDNVILHHGILERGIDFIQKPFTVETLARKVRQVLDK